MNTWKDGEAEYCSNLVAFHGDKNVPFGSVSSYLHLQRQCAARDVATAANRGDSDAKVSALTAVRKLDALMWQWAHVLSDRTEASTPLGDNRT